MTEGDQQRSLSTRRTEIAYIWTNLLGSPFWVLLNILPFILYKDLEATPLQITIITVLKPTVALFSFYWASAIHQRRDRLLQNVILAKVLGLLPFFFFPFVGSIWLMILAFALHMILFRGSGPGWMEILKLNLSPTKRNSVFARGSLVAHVGDALFPFAIGWILDDYLHAWRWLFPITAFISLASILLKARIPIPSTRDAPLAPNLQPTLIKNISQPWKNAWQLLTERPDFLRFLIGFMIGGAGMMIAHPLLPRYFEDVLHLSYTEMSLAINFCKGVGLTLTTPIWARLLGKMNFFQLSALPPLGICLFSACLIWAQYHTLWLFAAYFCYGVVQAGSHLCWHLSGPIFARHEESSPFSNVNVLAVGVRGCFIPPLGAVLGLAFGPATVIALGGALCFAASLTLAKSQPTAVSVES